MPTQGRAIGIIRVSRVKKREGDDFQSPDEQRERIESECERKGLSLLRCTDEMDVSGGTPLAEREGLREAVEDIEAGKADVIVGGYFDRFFRDLDVQRETVRRVEAADGYVLAVGFGPVTEATATEWLNGTMQGAFSEYQRRQTRERIPEVHRRAVERGVVPYPATPPGYERVTDERGKNPRFVPHPREAPIVADAFKLRASGVGIKEVRVFLKENGIERTYHGVQSLLKSKVVLGVLEFGQWINLHAHEPIVDEQTWREVQKMVVSRGRRPKSDHLLARLGVMRCGTCGAPMSIANSNQKYPVYRCNPTGDCPERMAITATIAEQVVVDQVRAVITAIQGSASVDASAVEAEQALDDAQNALRGAIKTLSGFEDVEGTQERLSELRQIRDDAQDRVDQLGSQRAVLTVSGDTDWDKLTIPERRALIKATIKTATVGPGRGAGRMAVELFA